MKLPIYIFLLFFPFLEKLYCQSTESFISKSSPVLPSGVSAKYSTAFQGNLGLLNLSGLKFGISGRFNDIEYIENTKTPFRWMQHYGVGFWLRAYLPLANERWVLYTDASAGYCMIYFPYEESLTSFVSRINPRYFGYFYSVEIGVRYRINDNFMVEFFSPDMTVKDFNKRKIRQISTSFPTFAIQFIITKPL